jgi:hypothetical protein
MRFPSTIYANPLIPHGYYWAKVTDLRIEHCGMERPRLWVELEIGPMHEEQRGLQLCSIIHPTAASVYFYSNFIHAFRISGMNYLEAIGRWASVEVHPAEYQGTEYSAVKYTHQPVPLRVEALRIEQAEKEGRLDEAALA